MENSEGMPPRHPGESTYDYLARIEPSGGSKPHKVKPVKNKYPIPPMPEENNSGYPVPPPPWGKNP